MPWPPRLTTSALAALTKRAGLLVTKLAAFALGIVLLQKLMFRAASPPADFAARAGALHDLWLVFAPIAIVLGALFALAGREMAAGRTRGEPLARAVAVLAILAGIAYTKGCLDALPMMTPGGLPDAGSYAFGVAAATFGAVLLCGAPAVYLTMLQQRAPDAPAPEGPYRAAAQPTQAPPAAPPTLDAALYAKACKDYGRRRTTILILAFTYLPGVWLIAFIGQGVLESSTPGAVASLAWMLGFAWNGMLQNWFPCPRCGERFISRRWGVFSRSSNPFTSKCLNCGIRVGEEPIATVPEGIP